jgi:Ca2+-binding EF-hand superfamily protein
MKSPWIIAALFVPLALAAHEPGKDGGHFDRIDADRDGTISRAEAASSPRLTQKFDKLDQDRNGNLTKAELDQHMHDKRQEMHDRMEQKFKSADADGDGQLSSDEAKGMSHIAQNFAAIDANGDGLVSRDELRARGKEMHKDKMHKDHSGRDHPEDKPQ